jgi:hypothetical protein
MVAAMVATLAGCGSSAAGNREAEGFVEGPTADSARFELTSEDDVRVSGVFDYGDHRGVMHISEPAEVGRWERDVRLVGDLVFTAWDGRDARWGFNEDVYWARMPVESPYQYGGDAAFPLLDAPGRRNPDEIWADVARAADEIVVVGPEPVRSVTTTHQWADVTPAEAGTRHSGLYLREEPGTVVRVHAWIDRFDRVRRMRFEHRWPSRDLWWLSVDFFHFGAPVDVELPERSLSEKEFLNSFSTPEDFDVPEGLTREEEDCYLAKLMVSKTHAALVCAGKVSLDQDSSTSCTLARAELPPKEAAHVCEREGEDS